MLKTMKYAVIIGGINIDIGAQSAHSLIAHDSNPGIVFTSLGGVGRNIAHDLRKLGAEVRFLSALGEDSYTSLIRENLQELGLDVSLLKKAEGFRNSTYLYINDAGGDMALAVSDMRLCEEISPAYLQQHLSLLNEAAVVGFDTNIPLSSIEWLAEHCQAPLFCDPVSVTKAEKLKGVLPALHTLKPNRIEAELLSGEMIYDEESLQRAAQVLLEKGLKEVCISLGSEGVYVADREKAFLQPAVKAQVASTTGAGDAFSAAWVRGMLEGESLEEKAAFAVTAAAIAVESEETINPLLSRDYVRERMKYADTHQ